MEPIILAGGSLSATVDPAGGALRRLTVNGECVVYRIFAAFRDRSWSTPQPVVTPVDQSGNRLIFNSDYTKAGYGLHAVTTVLLSGLSVRVTYRAEVSEYLERNRLGLCLLLPGTLSGTEIEAGHSSGGVTRLALPTSVAPHQPCGDISTLAFVLNGCRVTIRFEGEIFEMEDQRNWTDYSYKVYCTPLSLPRPVRLAAGTVVEQEITVTVEPSVNSRAYAGKPILRTIPSLPLLGTRITADVPHTLTETVPCDFARMDLRPDACPGDTGTMLAAATDLPLLVYDWGAGAAATDRAGELAGHRVLRSAAAHPLSGQLTPFLTGAATWPSVVGTDGGFAELNRSRPDVPPGSAVAFTVNPQVHDFDDEAVIDNLLGLRSVLDSARMLYPDAPLVLGLVELVPHNNPACADYRDNALRHKEEPRMTGEFAAAWGLAVFCEAAAAGVEAVTLYDSSGPFGLIGIAGPIPAARFFTDVRRLRDGGGPYTVTLPPASIGGADADGPVLTYRLAGRAIAIEAKLLPGGGEYRVEERA